MEITTNTVTEITSNSFLTGGEITGDTGDYKPIVDRLLTNRFQLYNRTRQKVTGEAKGKGTFHPFQMFQDSAQDNKKAVVGSLSYRPLLDQYEISLQEYDNETPITLE